MNKKNKLAYAMIEAAVDKGIRDIQEDPKRGIRNLVDLGQHFATARFQKDFCEITQQMLKNENSPYFELLNNTIKNVDHKILKRFGINLGYNNWTYGGEKIRKLKKEYGYSIPWTIAFDLRNKTPDALTSEEISSILLSSESLGIYSGIFFVGEDKLFIENLVEILSSHKDSAYFVFTQPEAITDELADSVFQAKNIVISLNMDITGENTACKNAALELLNKKCLYGIHSMYDESNIEYLMSDNYTNQIYELGCTFAFIVKQGFKELQSEENLSRFLKKARSADGYPFLLFDFYSDLADVNRKISAADCFICIKADGKIAVDNMDKVNKDLNIRDNSLQSVFMQTMPKTQNSHSL